MSIVKTKKKSWQLRKNGSPPKSTAKSHHQTNNNVNYRIVQTNSSTKRCLHNRQLREASQHTTQQYHEDSQRHQEDTDVHQ